MVIMAYYGKELRDFPHFIDTMLLVGIKKIIGHYLIILELKLFNNGSN
jgi:hypothetical protein